MKEAATLAMARKYFSGDKLTPYERNRLKKIEREMSREELKVCAVILFLLFMLIFKFPA